MSEDDNDDKLGKRTTPLDKWVAARVMLRRLELGMSQTRLAEILGLPTRNRVEKWERGQNRLYASHIGQLARALNVHPGWFFEGFPVPDEIPSTVPENMNAILNNPETLPAVQLMAQLNRSQRFAVMTMLRGMVSTANLPTYELDSHELPSGT
jgi:transcriptional regulator with XRE-family HTH domain